MTAPTTFNATDWLLHRHVRDGHGARMAVVCGGRSVTYEELSDETRRVAAGFRALGVRPEERVMLCMADGVELPGRALGGAGLAAPVMFPEQLLLLRATAV